MPTFSPGQLGINAPAGGFQEGGWYPAQGGGSYQYIGGTFGESGSIHPGSSQVGAGQKVSKEVNIQSDIAQGLTPGSIQKFVDVPPPTVSGVPTSAGISGPGVSPGVLGADGVGVPSISAPQTIDLAGQYKSLYQSSGVEGLEGELAEKERAFTEAKGGIDDNPFLQESERVGRQAKLQTLFDDRTKNLRDEIATKRADVETQLNLQLKQFDINSQASQDALSKLNTLLSLGALDTASGQDIANLTRSTGISSAMIQSAISSRTKEDIETTMVTSTDNAGNVTVSVLNSKTGVVIKKTSLGAVGGAKVDSGGKINEIEVKTGLSEDVRAGTGVRDIYSIYSGILDPNEILQIYNANSPHGPAKESAEELRKLGVDTDAFGIY